MPLGRATVGFITSVVLTTVDYFTHREGTISYVTDNSHLQIKHTVGQTGPIRKRRYQAIYNCFL